MKALKQQIKTLAAQQPLLKEQRKTVHFTGTRTLDPWPAFLAHAKNRHDLRLYYAVIGLIKGKTLQEIEPHNKSSKLPLAYYQKTLDKLRLVYEEQAAHHNQ